MAAADIFRIPGEGKDHIPEVMGLGAVLALSWILEWRTPDLVWSLWMASLLIGSVIIAGNQTTELLEFRRESLANKRGWTAVAAASNLTLLLMLAFYGFAHLLHAYVLDQFFPLTDFAGGGADLTPEQIASVFAVYLPAVVIYALGDKPNLLEKVGRGGKEEWNVTGRMLRLHIVLVFLAVCAVIGLDSFLIFIIAFAVFFYPVPKSTPDVEQHRFSKRGRLGIVLWSVAVVSVVVAPAMVFMVWYVLFGY